MTWPPPPTIDSPWYRATLRTVAGDPPQIIRVREVGLWGHEVVINEACDSVWCERCRRFVSVAELGRRGVHTFDSRPQRGVFAVVQECAPSPTAGDLELGEAELVPDDVAGD